MHGSVAVTAPGLSHSPSACILYSESEIRNAIGKTLDLLYEYEILQLQLQYNVLYIYNVCIIYNITNTNTSTKI